MLNNYYVHSETFKNDSYWKNPEEALDALKRFCLVLNCYYQGKPADVDMSDIW